MRLGALPEGNIEELINRARSYIKAYRQPPYGMEVQGTTELLKAMADKLEEYKDLEDQGKPLKLPCKVGDMVYEAQEFPDGLKKEQEMESRE